MKSDSRQPGFGLLTFTRVRLLRELYGIELMVSLRGESLSSRCLACDDREGWALVYELDHDGLFRRTPDGASMAPILLVGPVWCTARVAGNAAGATLATACNQWAPAIDGPVTDPIEPSPDRQEAAPDAR